ALEYIEVTLDDIATANRLAHEVLGRSLDELPPQTRRLLLLVDEMVSAECERQKIERTDFRFSRRDVRQYTGWGDTQLAVHLRRLEELEYLLVHRGGRGRSLVYELAYQKPAPDQQHLLAGLTDAHCLRRNLPALEPNRPVDVRPISGPLPGHFRPPQINATPDSSNGFHP